jgi:phospholipid transport system substrate-binding protein
MGMEMPIGQGFMTGRFEQRERAEAVAGRGAIDGRQKASLASVRRPRSSVFGVWLAILLLPALGQTVDAKDKDPTDAKGQPAGQSASRATDANDPNELWWRKWDVTIKDPNNPNELLAAKLNAVLKVLQAKDLDQQTKARIVDRILTPIFDFPLMGQLAVGRAHWPKLNPAQREKFTQLFVERLKALYLEKTAFYTNEKITLKPAEQKKTTAQIPMVVLSEGKEIAILYKLRKVDDQSKGQTKMPWKIYDVEIAGVSILLTYRSQFDDILRRGTVGDLLASLEKPARP